MGEVLSILSVRFALFFSGSEKSKSKLLSKSLVSTFRVWGFGSVAVECLHSAFLSLTFTKTK